MNEGLNSRWYAGSGIYRHVWLMKTDKVHLDEWDTFIDASKVEGKKRRLIFTPFYITLAKKKVTAHLKIQIFSPQGEEVYSTTQPVNISGETNIPISLTFDIKAGIMVGI